MENECWLEPGNEMYEWAFLAELQERPFKHGLGDIDRACEPGPGTSCPACGRVWPAE